MNKSKEGVTPYWNEACKQWQSKLWCPTSTDSQEWEETSPLIKSLTNNQKPQTYALDSLPVSVDQQEAELKQVTKKIRIYPEDESVFEENLHGSRLAYNKAVAEFRKFDACKGEAERGIFKASTPSKNQTSFRRDIRNEVCDLHDCSRTIVDEAVNLAYNARQAVVRKRKQGQKATLNFRSRKSARQSFVINKLSKQSRTLKYFAAEAIPPEAFRQMATVYRENGRWFLCCAQLVPVLKSESQALRVVALDPGVSTFLTTFSHNSSEKIGDGFAASIYPLLKRLDEFISKRARFLKKCPCRSDWQQCHRDRFRYFEKRIHKLRNRVKDLVTNLHWQAAHFISENYDVAFLPTFEVKDMVGKGKRKLWKPSVRKLLSLSHYQFKLRLKWVMSKKGKHVIDCNEAYTSKTDSRTGELVDIKGSKTINGLDRDVNGARGIFLRSMAT